MVSTICTFDVCINQGGSKRVYFGKGMLRIFIAHCVQLTARVLEYSGNKFPGIEHRRYNSELNSGPWL